MKTKEERSSYHLEYMKTHRKEGRKAVKKWSDNNKDKARHSQLKYYFGISLEEYNKIFTEQKGCCKICGKHQTEFKKALFVDHDHTTGKIRGLLCLTCNLLIGRTKDDITILERALTYLKNNTE
jgi:hypothetical protein